MRLVCFRRFLNLERKGSTFNQTNRQNEKDQKVRKVVTFEDCVQQQQVNQQIVFVDERMEEVGVKNQYFAALAGQ